MMPCSRRALVGSVALAPLFGCGGASTRAESTEFDAQRQYRGPLVDPAAIPGDFMWEQRITARHGEKKGGFDAVVQKKGSELLVLGLTPVKTRGFSLTQTGTDYEFKQFIPFELPFSPASVLFDIHRAFFYRLLKPFPEAKTRKSSFEKESLVDTFYDGRLFRRTFSNVSGTQGELVIQYEPSGYARGIPPEITKLDNYAYGYSLIVETTSTQAL